MMVLVKYNNNNKKWILVNSKIFQVFLTGIAINFFYNG